MAIVRKDKMLAGYNGNLESVKVYNSGGTTEIETTNGVFVVVEGLLAGERETKKGRLADAADAGTDVLFIHNSEVMYDERLYKLSDFRIQEGKVARAYRLYDGDIMTLTNDLFVGSVANGLDYTVDFNVGDILIVQANGKIGKPVDPLNVDNAKVKFKVIENSGYELDVNMGAHAVQVIRN